MATVAAKDWRAELTTPTVRHFCRAVGIAVGLLGFGALLYVFEKYLLQPPRRFVENPGSVMMRAGGLAHFIMGWLYLFTSPRIRNHSSFFQLSALGIVGAVLCAVAGALGGLDNPFLYLIFFSYFLAHEIRDERELYRATGDAPNASPGADRFSQRFSLAVLIGLVALVAVGYLLHGYFVQRLPLLQATPTLVFVLLGTCTAVVFAWAVQSARKCARQSHGSWQAALDAHSPLVFVYGALFLVLLLGAALGGISLNLLILIHGSAWVVFVYYRLQGQAKPVRNLWDWLRGTPVGFLVLHGAVFAAILLLMAVRVYVWQRTGIISTLIERSSFPYWSIMHITLAFWRPR